ncbi:MAG: hypothetical protein ACE5R4_06815 [Armatimonadota bacterium]
MTRMFIILVLVVALIAVGVWALVGSGLPAGKHGGHGHKAAGMAGLKDAKVEVTNIENGVIAKVTSDDPDTVALIQQHFASFGDGRGCPGKCACCGPDGSDGGCGMSDAGAEDSDAGGGHDSDADDHHESDTDAADETE